MGHDRVRCWCGNERLEPFSEEYLRCPACESLVLMQWPAELLPTGTDEQAYYGKEYWLSHQEQDLKLPGIQERAHTDLVDRVPYWLEKVLQVQLPPARALDLGCANGSLVAMLRQVGFDASGLELSPWVVDFARKTFNIPMCLGPIEEQDIEPHSLDLLILMDVIEHLPDPPETLRKALTTLRPGGLVMLQTPAYPAGKSFAELSAAQDPFLKMLIPGDHLFLFSPQALQQLLNSSGLPSIVSEPALFPYDQFIFASAAPITRHSPAEITVSLKATPHGRLALAQIELFQKLASLEKLFQQADADRNGRLENIRILEDQIAELEQRLAESETDRAVRLEKMNELDHLLAISEADRAARLEAIHALAHTLNEKELEIKVLGRRLVEFEASQAAQLATIDSLEKQIKEKNDEKDALSQRIAAYENGFLRVQRLFSIRKLLGKKSITKAEIAKPKLKRVLVDLTPVRPGGVNGGAKPLTLELLKRLSQEIAPEVEFILLTSSDAHAELAWLDRSNVRRICVNQIETAPLEPVTISGTQAEKKTPLIKRTTRSIGKVLERIFPAATYRNIYRFYRHDLRAPQIQNLVRSLAADLVFCPFPAIYYYAPEVPVIAIVYDLQHLNYPEFFSPEERYHIDTNFRLVCQKAARIVSISEYSRKSILENQKMDPGKVVTFPHTLFTQLSPQPGAYVSRVLEDYQLSMNDYLFFPANFWEHKNHALLLTAFNLFCRKHPESKLKLLCTGAPNQRMQFLQQAVEKMGLAGRVTFAGYVSLETLAAFYQGCKALIFPSLFEGFGVPVLEAMLMQKPVLCSAVTSLPEVGGDAVMYFDPRIPGDIVHAIEKITGDPELAATLVQRGNVQVARYNNPRHWAECYFQVFQEVFEGERVYQNSLSGLYTDQWASHTLEISVAGGAPQRLEIELSVPIWSPKDQVVQFSGSVIKKPCAYTIHRGTKRTLEIALSERSGILAVDFATTVSPSDLKINEDTRPLSCLVHTCRLVSATQRFNLISGETM